MGDGRRFARLMGHVDSKFPLVQTCLVGAVHVPSAPGGGDETFFAVVIHVSLFSASFTGSIGPD